MATVFDLSGISRLIETQHPARILVVDTNVVMNDPALENWNVSASGQSLFVLSDTIAQELERIQLKEGTKEKAESRDKAKTAIKSLNELFKRGRIADGIQIKAGWVISIPSPKKDVLYPEIEQLSDIASVFGRSDTKLLLLTRECYQRFASTPVTFLTGELNLFNAVEMQGLPCHLYSGFPVEKFKEVNALAKPLNWDKELLEIQSRTRETAAVIELTLTAQRCAPQWTIELTEIEDLIVAEGTGIMRTLDRNRPFLWQVSFRPQTLETRQSPVQKDRQDLPLIHLDFFGQDDFAQNLFDGIADRLLDATSVSLEEGTPTLQSPQSVMEMLSFYEFISQKGLSDDTVERLQKEIDEAEGMSNFWAGWVLSKSDDEKYGDERFTCLENLLSDVTNCWKVGQADTFRLAV